MSGETREKTSQELCETIKELLSERDQLREEVKQLKWAAKVNSDEHSQYQDYLLKDRDHWKSVAGKMAEAVKATDIYFKALCEQWEANEGRLVSESGMLINASADIQQLCETAGEKVIEALAQYNASRSGEK